MIYTNAVKQIHIIASSRCNLRCAYCYESNKGNREMDVDKVLPALAAEIEATDAGKPIVLSMHGGEPMLAIKQIKRLSTEIWEMFPDRKIYVNIITNGTILTDEIRQWLKENPRRVDVAVSLDGLPEVHNRNRCGSYGKIDFDFFLSLHPRVYAKMTVAPGEIAHMAAGFEHLYNMGFMPNMTLTAECEYSDDDLAVFAVELDKIIEFYRTHNDIPVTEMLDIPFERMSSKAITPRHRCGIGANRAAFDTEGNRYPCQTFISDFSKPYDAEEYVAVDNRIGACRWEEICPDCRECDVRELCPSCYGLNHSNRGDIGRIDRMLCKTTPMRLAAAARLWAELIINKDKYPWIAQTISDEELGLKSDGILNFIKRTHK